MKKGSGAILIGLVVWIMGIGFSLWVSILVQTSNPDWQALDSPDCYIGAGVVVLSIFLSYLPFAIVGGCFVLPGLRAYLSN